MAMQNVKIRWMIRIGWIVAHALVLFLMHFDPHNHLSLDFSNVTGIPPLIGNLAAQIVAWCILFAVILSYFGVSLSSPGYVGDAKRKMKRMKHAAEGSLDKGEAKSSLENVEIGENSLNLVSLQGPCHVCGISQPLRTKHCRTCNRCVRRMDHHCVWAANCVGQFNHRTFILYVFLQHLVCLFILVEAIISIVIGWGSIFLISGVFCALITGVFSFFTFILMRLHYRLISVGFTTFEYLSGVRLPFSRGRLWGDFSPYSLGNTRRNLVHFFTVMHETEYVLPGVWSDVNLIPTNLVYRSPQSVTSQPDEKIAKRKEWREKLKKFSPTVFCGNKEVKQKEEKGLDSYSLEPVVTSSQRIPHLHVDTNLNDEPG